MAYTINRYNGNVLTTVVDGSVNNSVTDIKLVGYNVSGYGEFIAEDLVHMLENFANDTSPVRPITGQLWYDTGDDQLKILVSESPNTYEIINSRYDSSSLAALEFPPQPRPAGELFWNAGDGIDAAGMEYVSDGTQWLPFAPLWQSSEPTVDATHNFGSSSKAWNNIYATTVNASNLTLSGNTASTTDTNGDWIFAPNGTGSVRPSTDNTVDLGEASYRWATVYATTLDGEATSARYADLAERYASDMDLEAGDLVSLGGEAEITKTTKFMDKEVFGVVSTKPGLMMNSAAGDDRTHPYIALSGRVPVKVIGKVEKGQRLVASSTAGVAIGVNLEYAEQHPFAVIGRALANKTTDGIELLEAVVSIN